MCDNQIPGTSCHWSEELLNWREAESFPAGEVLFRCGVGNPDVYLIKRGFVELTTCDPVDGLDRCIAWRQAGQLVGDCPAVLKAPSPFAAKTSTSCLLYRMSAERFASAFGADHSSVLWQLARDTSRRYLDLVSTLTPFHSRRARFNLEVILWQLVAEQRPHNDQAEVRLTEYSPSNKELAGYVGVNPTYIPSLFAELKEDGIARRIGGMIVCQPSKLFHQSVKTVASALHPIGWQNLLKFGEPHRFEAGYTVFEQGKPCDMVYLLDHGFVDLQVFDPTSTNGRDQSVLWARRGELLGEHSALLNVRHDVTAVTRTRSTLYHIPADAFLDSLRANQHPAAFRLVLSQIKDLRDLRSTLIQGRSQPLRRRLENILWKLFEQQYGPEIKGEVRLTDYSPSNSALASYMGTEERYVSSLMQELREERIAWRGAGRRVITVRAPHRLFRSK